MKNETLDEVLDDTRSSKARARVLNNRKTEMELQDLYKQVIPTTLSETDFVNMSRNSPSKYVQTRADPELVKAFSHSVLYMHLPTVSLEDPKTGEVTY